MRRARDINFVGVYEHKKYRIDVMIHNGSWEAYIYEKTSGIKEMMFGVSTEQTSLLDFLEMVEFHLEDGNKYIKSYKEDMAIIDEAFEQVMFGKGK